MMTSIACIDSFFTALPTGRHDGLRAAVLMAGGNLLGSGMPIAAFVAMVTGMEESDGGFPYKAYPE